MWTGTETFTCSEGVDVKHVAGGPMKEASGCKEWRHCCAIHWYYKLLGTTYTGFLAHQLVGTPTYSTAADSCPALFVTKPPVLLPRNILTPV